LVGPRPNRKWGKGTEWEKTGKKKEGKCTTKDPQEDDCQVGKKKEKRRYHGYNGKNINVGIRPWR